MCGSLMGRKSRGARPGQFRADAQWCADLHAAWGSISRAGMRTIRESICTIDFGGDDASTVKLQGSKAGPVKRLFAHAQSCSLTPKPRATMVVLATIASAVISSTTFFHEVQASADGGTISDCFSDLNTQLCIGTRTRFLVLATITGAGRGKLALDSLTTQQHHGETMLTFSGAQRPG